MTKAWLSVVIVAVVFGGCAGLRQFPEVSQSADALNELDRDYKQALDRMYPSGNASTNTSVDAERQKLIRNEFIERRMAVMDAHFKTFEAGLVKENVRVDFGIALLGIGVGAAGSLVAETASQILSAVSGGLAGAQAAYGKAVLYDKAMSALVAQMHAGRKTIAAQIFQRWPLDIEKYPMWMARTDLDAYYFAGSLPGAILATAADAKTKEKDAEAILLRPITLEAVSDEMFRTREELESDVDRLGAAEAKDLVTKIARQFTEVQPLVNRQYPTRVRDADTQGTKAKVLLKRLISGTVRSPGDAEKWQNAIEGR